MKKLTHTTCSNCQRALKGRKVKMKKDLHTKLPPEFVCKSKNQYVMCYSIVILIIAYFTFKAKRFLTFSYINRQFFCDPK